jgi:hypothetical protein
MTWTFEPQPDGTTLAIEILNIAEFRRALASIPRMTPSEARAMGRQVERAIRKAEKCAREADVGKIEGPRTEYLVMDAPSQDAWEEMVKAARKASTLTFGGPVALVHPKDVGWVRGIHRWRLPVGPVVMIALEVA